MKKKNIIRVCGLALVSSMAMSSCSDILDEQPRSGYTPEFFTSEEGVKGGLTALYSGLRNIYGQAYIYSGLEAGTDEYTWAQSGNSEGFKASDMVTNMTPTNNATGGIWGEGFKQINTALTVIENADAVGIDKSLIAEARFFVGLHFFNIVQNFGGCPLDLGSGELKSNSTPKRTGTRNTVAEVYEKAIFPYLETAVADLPEKSRLTGTVTKTTARLVLAKAYLTYGWWLENPNDIPTYPTCTRDASKAQSYFQKALTTAQEALNDKASANGLEDYYYLANIAQNDRNKEWLLWADHTEESEQYNGGSLGYGGGGAPDNFAGWFNTWNYCAWLTGMNLDKDGKIIYSEEKNKDSGELDPITIVPVQREASQPLGRPWTRIAATANGLAKFTNTDIDTRWDGTFTSQYRVNYQKTNSFCSVYGPNGSQIKAYETYLKFLPSDVDDSKIVYQKAVTEKRKSLKDGKDFDYYLVRDSSGVQAGSMIGEKSWVISAKMVSRSRYPGMWKLGPCRTDYSFENALGSPNAGSTRPFAILKYSEFYLVAAEAAVKLNNQTVAKDMVNVLRARAGKCNYVVNEGSPSALFSMKGDDLRKLPLIADKSAEMVAATPASIDIDYILDERLREFWGEGIRWYDLVRTQKWNEVADKYTICADFSLNKETVERTITKQHYLRPIPQDEIDKLQMSEEEKKAFQNPGY